MYILDLIKNHISTKSIDEKKNVRYVVDDSLSLALTLSTSFKNNPRNIFVVAPNLYQGQTLYEQIEAFLGKDNVLFYPFDEIIRIDQVSSSKEMLLQRLFVLNECLKNKPYIFVAHLSSTLHLLPKKELFKKNIITLKKNNEYNLKDLVNKLIELGFKRVNKIDQEHQFALRGDILDIFPINSNLPYRIEFFDVEIESIRNFDIALQTSIDSNYDEIEIFPASEYLFDKSEFNNFKNNVINEFNKETENVSSLQKNNIKKRIEQDLALIEQDGFNDNLYPYFNFLESSNHTILDYIDIDTLILYNYDKMQDAYDFFALEVDNYFNELFNNGLFIKNVTYFKSLKYLENLNNLKTYSYSIDENDVSLPLRGINYFSNNIINSLDLIKKYFNEQKDILICMDKLGLKTYQDYLNSENIEYYKSIKGEVKHNIISLFEFDLKEGFELIDQNIVILTKKEILGYRSYSSRYVARYKKAEILSNYEELKKGDYVVHEEHGIGVFQEITTLTFEDEQKDYLKIMYADNEYLYVPLEKFSLIRKYVGKEGAVPKISKIGRSDWKKTKKKIKDKINDITERLISLYANRETKQGFSFLEDDEIQKQFEDAFPFPLTQDQQRCLSEIKKDMEAPTPMDRLLCGDVGFGKTEVAFRAAFKAILSNKQVALLCPTTILAKQHYEVATQRFASFGVKIAIFSRFIPLSEQKKQIERIKNGEIHLIIGTHRLLSKEIVIPSLGLLIVDEEQRFGVEHKERIKEMSQNIDVLTLSATPIPRTLQMSLIGIRKLSTIDSAPINRMPIQTYVLPQNDKLIYQVIERELSREGQVFYIHNKVSSIYLKAKKIQNAIKNAKVGIVHGQMDKEDIDEIMDAYYQGKINVLVSTSIVETGLDVPNANTMIVENADQFGLAQLYQIKGRVGRSSRVAYAYLFFNEGKELKDKSQKRLQAIKEFTELGSGYKIAQRDLNIRGAGDILGAKQSGFVDSIGMDMYLKIVKEVMEKKTNSKAKEKEVKAIALTKSGFIPTSYANDEQKIELYQEIQNTHRIVSLELLKRKIRDIYGKLPKEVEELLKKRKIDILADSRFITSVIEQKNVVITLSKEFNNISQSALKLNKKLMHLNDYIFARFKDGVIVIDVIKDKTLLDNLEEILEAINSIGEQNYENR